MSASIKELSSRREQQHDLAAGSPTIGLREILALAFKQRRRVLIALLLPPIIAVTLLFVLPKIYRAESDILVKIGREYLAQVEGESGMSAPTSTKQEGINSEIALLSSRAVEEATIRAIGMEHIYPDLVDPTLPPEQVMDLAVKQFDHDVSVDPVKLSNVISVSFDADSPRQAEMVVNRLINAYIAKHTQVFAGRHAEGYKDSIDRTLSNIDRLEQQATRIKLANGIYDIAAQRAALISQRVEAQSHLQDVVNNQATLQKRLGYLTMVRPQIANTTHTTNTDASDEGVHANEALTDLRQSEAAMSARYGANNPDLQKVRTQIAALEHGISPTGKSRTSLATAPSALAQQVDQEIVMGSAELAPLDAEITRYTALIGSIGAELYRLEQADLDLRTTSSRIEVLTDDLKTAQEHYDQARTQEQTDLAKQVSVVQVAPAIAPEKAAKPKKLLFVAGGLLLGLMAAGGVVVLSLLTNKTVLTEDALERLVGLPVLVSIPFHAAAAGSRRRKPG